MDPRLLKKKFNSTEQSQKKGFHTLSCLRSENKDIVVYSPPDNLNFETSLIFKKEDGKFSNYFYNIKKKLDSTTDLREAQNYIENNWIDIIRDLHEHQKYIDKKYQYMAICAKIK